MNTFYYCCQSDSQRQPYKRCIAECIQQKKLIVGMVVGLKRRIGIGRLVRVSVGNDFAARKLVGVPKYNTIQQHQGK